MKDFFDLDKDGEVTEEELEKAVRMKHNKLELDMLKDRSRMAWFSLYCMGLYPFLIIGTSIFGFEGASVLLSDITGVYFGSIAVVVAAFMGSEAYATKNLDEESRRKRFRQ